MKKIIDVIDGFGKTYYSYVDFGCSNGYITNIIKKRYCVSKVIGLDHTLKNLDDAKKKYPDIKFDYINLNDFGVYVSENQRYDLVTSFEVLEHVGNVENALLNIIARKKDTGIVFISVPIEIGFYGIVKYVLKIFLYGYDLSELNIANKRGHKFLYFKELLFGGDISKFRDIKNGFGTHFGFDYRVIDNILVKKSVKFKSFSFLTTRFYVVR